MHWDDDVQYLKGVGPKRAEKFAHLGIHTVGDLLCLYPRGYIDYSNPLPVATAPYGTPCTVRAEVLHKTPPVRISGGRTMARVQCADDTGALELVFFNNPYVLDKLAIGEEYLFYGKVGGAFTQREMVAPTFVPAAGGGAPAPLYPLGGGLKNHEVAKPAEHALQVLEDLTDPLPPQLLEKYRLPGKLQALRMLHRPAG
ncbi:ATP-dependent DNA helicase RecG, partial [Ruminococcaceae bacterium OttesenSCG-928-O06]|nr:ATP-dependent DNA helicase RecG [Ruminococcaceae bacterium OttesenSCG-928-O06]